MLREAYDKFVKVTRAGNQYGINLPMVKDPKTGLGSVSLTLVVISSIFVILGLVGKWSGRLGVVDINNSLEFFYASCVLYFGRNTWTGGTPTKKAPVKDDEALQARMRADDPDA